jgi:hypothetical protein
VIFSFQKPQTAFVSPRDLFSTEQKALPGVRVYSDEKAAKNRSAPRKGMIAGRQWYAVEIPAADTFLYRAKPVAEQPFPVLHRLLSQKSLSVLFTDELSVFAWQLSCYLKDKKPEEAASLTAEETTAFYHEKRNALLSLPSGGALINLVSERAKKPKVLPAYFSALNISGVIDKADGAMTFLIFNPRASVKIISMHRDAITHQGSPIEKHNGRMGENGR